MKCSPLGLDWTQSKGAAVDPTRTCGEEIAHNSDLTSIEQGLAEGLWSYCRGQMYQAEMSLSLLRLRYLSERRQWRTGSCNLSSFGLARILVFSARPCCSSRDSALSKLVLADISGS